MPQDFDLSQFKATYFEECQDLLATAEDLLGTLQAELTDVDVETLHAIFRCVHSIKGGAGAFNFTELVNFSHILETLLDKLREGEIQITAELADCLIRSNDVLLHLVQMAQDEEEVEDHIWSPVAAELKVFTSGQTTVKAEPEPAAPMFADYNLTPEEEIAQGWGLFIDPVPTSPDEVVKVAPEPEVEKPKAPKKAAKASKTKVKAEPQIEKVEIFEEDIFVADKVAIGPHYLIRFVPQPHLLRFANEPLLLSRELHSLGKCHVELDCSRLPDLDDLHSDEAYFNWVFRLESDCSLADIEEVFEFVVDDCELSIQRIEENFVSGEIKTPTVEFVAPDNHQEDEAQLEEDEEESEDILLLAEPALPEITQEKQPVKVEPSKPQSGEAKSTSFGPKISSIRVDLDRVDRLVNMVGELVITQSMLKQQAEDLANNAGGVMAQGFEELSAHTRELQESVMAIRMQPVKSVFARMPRLVRELSAKLNKRVDLITNGEMTEVDKTVIEQLMDPLTHMIRNSLDHGIEGSEERLSKGKPERATIHLNADHRSGRIQIEVIDDGRGIDRGRVLSKAIEKGIVAGDAELSDEEIDNLIFAPGFSTADEVSDVSGRGVGMDVVRRNVVNLGGRISVFSTPGKGTRFLLSLPLTLAVLDGMIVKCGDEKYIIPLTSIIESIHPMKEEIENVSGGLLVSVRGEYIRVVNLYKLFNVRNAITNPLEALIVIVETERYGHVGILVDELLGQQQVVIKSLEENYDPIPGIAAATILGNGRVALILDVDGLSEMEHGVSRQQKFGSLTKQVLLTGEQSHGIDR